MSCPQEKSIPQMKSFSDNSFLDENVPNPTNKEKPDFGSVPLKNVLESAEKPDLVSVVPSIPISQALEVMKNNKIFSLPLKSRSQPGNSLM